MYSTCWQEKRILLDKCNGVQVSGESRGTVECNCWRTQDAVFSPPPSFRNVNRNTQALVAWKVEGTKISRVKPAISTPSAFPVYIWCDDQRIPAGSAQPN
ncbi:unnamed protein product [Phyllotreta striolata]|uniref:Uncharacterized protein n=1 Tax=Phyllotreta striolata TaxID=444603 RepID=A0A9N9XR54_PHYSR|nr:unnamed protein product [Phyllotreta striolata]